MNSRIRETRCGIISRHTALVWSCSGGLKRGALVSTAPLGKIGQSTFACPAVRRARFETWALFVALGLDEMVLQSGTARAGQQSRKTRPFLTGDVGECLKAANSNPAPASDRHSRLMKRTQSARIKAPSKGIGEGVATLLQVYRSRSFMKTCQAGRRRAPPW